jgi:hypothetical protein
MIALILFGIVFLVGVSLFAALVGTSILKKNARVVRVTGPSRPPHALAEQGGRQVAAVSPEAGSLEQREAADYESRYKQEFKDELGDLREEVEARSEREAEAAPGLETGSVPRPGPGGPQLPLQSAGSGGGGRAGIWVLVGVLALTLFSGALYVTLRGWPSVLTEPKLYFCEYVDFARQKPVNRSDTFSRGNVTLFVKSPQQLELNSARIEIYRLGEQQEPYAQKNIPLRPSWMSFAVQILFEHTGNYRVSVLGEDGTPIGIGRLTIVPDTYAYKPVPEEPDAESHSESSSESESSPVRGDE